MNEFTKGRDHTNVPSVSLLSVLKCDLMASSCRKLLVQCAQQWTVMSVLAHYEKCLEREWTVMSVLAHYEKCLEREWTVMSLLAYYEKCLERE